MKSVPLHKIADRVRKLLARSKSSNPHEAAAAAELAQKLMQEHKLAEADVTDDVGDTGGLTEVSVNSDGMTVPWRFHLVTVVARAFFCEALALRSGPTSKRRVRIVGGRDDAPLAAYVFKFLAGEVERLAGEEMREPMVAEGFLWSSELDELLGTRHFSTDSRSYKDAFRRGAVLAIAEKLKEAAEVFAKKSDKALVLVRRSRQGIHEHIRSKYGHREQREVDLNGGRGRRLLDEDGLWRGYVRGREVKIPGCKEEDQLLLKINEERKESHAEHPADADGPDGDRSRGPE